MGMTFRYAKSLGFLVALACLTLWPGGSAAASSKDVLRSQFGSTGSEAGQFNGPKGVAVDQATHDVYVADSGNHRVDKFDEAGVFIEAWGWGVADGLAHTEVCALSCQAGLEGSGAGQFTTPIGMAVDSSGGPSTGDVYVGDESTGRVTKLSSAGAFLGSIEAGDEGPFSSIYGVAVDKHGDLWVYDSSSEVYEFDPTGVEIRQWNTEAGSSYGLAVDSSEHVYAVRGSKGMLEFSSGGELLGEFDAAKEKTEGFAADLVSGALFSDQGTFIAEYVPPILPSSEPTSVFGGGELTEGTYVAVDSAKERVFVTEASSGVIDIFGAPPPNPPQIQRVAVRSVSAETASLSMRINTARYDTRYYVEYGTSLPSGIVAPVVHGELQASVTEATVNVFLEDLSPGTTYYYRAVAENQNGEVAKSGEGQRFTTYPLASSGLPDRRAYELVSPPDKNGGDVGVLGKFVGQAGADGEEINYASLSSFLVGNPQSGKLDEYLSRRGSGGWNTQAISPSITSFTPASVENPFVGLSENLDESVLGWDASQLTPEAALGYENLYLGGPGGPYRLITTVPPPNKSAPKFVGASSDYSHVVFEIGDALTPDGAGESNNVYEWAAGKLALVSVPPGSHVGVGGAIAGDGSTNWHNAVSADGKKVFWTDGAGQLYMYEQGQEAVKINASTRKPTSEDGSATFEGATASGEWVFFSDTAALTDTAGDQGGLYGYDTLSEKLTVLDPDGAGETGFEGVVGFGEDGGSVYFVASGVLTGARPGGAAPVAGQPNLYVASDGAIRFITTLFGGEEGDEGDWIGSITSRHAAVTPDGKDIVFMSMLPLTGYENVDLSTGKSDSEVFMYDFDRDKLTCVSCSPENTAPIGTSTVPDWVTSSYNSNYLSNDGDRVFFDSKDSLTPNDTNGRQDVYEWERGGRGGCDRLEGCVHLISSGTGSSDSILMAAGASGSDVFFATNSKLAPEDGDEGYDVYDARVEGGFPAPTTLAPCSGEACLGPLSSPPGIVTPPSTLAATSSEATLDTRSARRPPTLELARIGMSALRRFLRTGRLTLVATASESGRIAARLTVGNGARPVRMAKGHVQLSRPGKARFTLRLGKAARKRLARRRDLKITLEVSYSRLANPKRLTFVLRGEGVER
jgi:hypothetical protein